MTSSLLRARLVAFVLEAEARAERRRARRTHPRLTGGGLGAHPERRGPVPGRIPGRRRRGGRAGRPRLAARGPRSGRKGLRWPSAGAGPVRGGASRRARREDGPSARPSVPVAPRRREDHQPLREAVPPHRPPQQDALRHRPRRRAEPAGDGRRCRRRGPCRLDARLRVRGHHRPRRRPDDALQPSRPHAGARGNPGGEGDAAGPRRPDRHRDRRAPPLRVLEGRRRPRSAEGLREAGR